MKKTALLVMAAAISLFAIACTEPPSNEMKGTVQTVPSTVPNKKVSGTDEYVEKARVLYPTASRSDLIDLGKQSCEVVRSIGSVEGALLAFATNPDFVGMESEAAYILGAAIPAFCSEYYLEALALVE